MRVTAAHAAMPVAGQATALRQPGAQQPAAIGAHGHCSTCSLQELCLPFGSSGKTALCTSELIHSRKRMKRGEYLYREGDPFHSLYAVRGGFFKSSLCLADGREQVTAFHMMGELMGMDGIGAGLHGSSAIALQDSEVCGMSYERLICLSDDMQALVPRFHRMMSREIVRDHGVLLLLGSMRAEQRLAVFLLNLSQRFTARGYSPREFSLCMSREEIGSYLGMTLETVSRVFSKFRSDGLLCVEQRQIRILDLTRLSNVNDSRLQ